MGISGGGMSPLSPLPTRRLRYGWIFNDLVNCEFTADSGTDRIFEIREYIPYSLICEIFGVKGDTDTKCTRIKRHPGTPAPSPTAGGLVWGIKMLATACCTETHQMASQFQSSTGSPRWFQCMLTALLPSQS